MALRVEDEGGVIIRAVMRPQAGRTLVATTAGERRRMERVDRSPIGGSEGEMEARPGRVRVGDREESQTILATRRAIADPLLVTPDPHQAERRHDRVVEISGLGEIADTERDMAQHDQPAVTRAASAALALMTEGRAS
jgi:hypothetical protein